MKNLLLMLSLLLSVQAFSKEGKGTIHYDVTIKLDIELEGEMAAFAEMLPKEQTSKRVLYYSPEATLYKAEEKRPEEHQASVNGMDIDIKVEEPENITYRHFADKKLYHKREFMGRDFLVTEEAEQANWKMTGKQKEILGYPCQQAISVIEEDTVVVWFTPAIPVSSGPAGLGALPGMILEVHQDGGNVQILATKIDEGIVADDEFVQPRGGKKVSKKEYDEIVAEKTKEMQQQYGGSGKNGIIRMKVTQTR